MKRSPEVSPALSLDQEAISKNKFGTELQLPGGRRGAGNLPGRAIWRNHIPRRVLPYIQRRIRKSEICVISQIENVQPQLGACSLGNSGCLRDREIDLSDAWRHQGIPAQITENANRLRLEGRWIETKDSAGGLVNAGRIAASARNQIWAFGIRRCAARSHVGPIESVVDAVWSARVNIRDEAQLPTLFEPVAAEWKLHNQIAGPVVT